MRNALIGALACVLLMSSGSLACAPASNPASGTSGTASSGAAPGAAASSAPVALRHIEVPLVSTAASMVPFWVAAEHGQFRRHGLEVTLVPMPPATAAQALSAGSVPIAIAGGSVASAYVGGATDLVYVAAVSSKAPYRVVVHPDITRMEDLRGKTIGVSTPGASPSVAMIEVLRRYGLEPDRDVSLVYMRDGQASVTALFTGVIHGFAQSSPEVERAVAEGFRVLLDMRDLDVPILGPQVATTRGLLERDPDCCAASRWPTSRASSTRGTTRRRASAR